MKKITFILIFSLIIMSFGLSMSFYSVSRDIIKEKESLYQSYFEITNQYKRKAGLLTELSTILAEDNKYSKLNKTIKRIVIDSNIKLNLQDFESESLSEFSKYVKGLDSTLNKGIRLVQEDPRLEKHPKTHKLKKDIKRANIRIKVSRQRHDRTIKTYNKFLADFPQSVVNRYYLKYEPWPLWLNN